jgi:peptide/nickel transport system substrate-binding protein
MAMAVGSAVLVATAGLVAGCGGMLGASGSGSADPIMVGTTDSVIALDPAGAYNAGSWALFNGLYQGLLAFRPGSTTPVPDAARHCGFTDQNLLVYECTMKPDLEFSNGDKLTAEDVAYSFQRTKRIKALAGPAPLLSTMKSVRAEGDRVVFRLNTPDATWPYKIGSGAGAIVDSEIYPKDAVRKGDTTVGSGPYALKSYQAADTAKLVRNAAYKGAFKVRNDAVTVKYFKSPELLETAWKKRTVDVTSRVLPPQVYRGLDGADLGEKHIRVSSNKGTSTRSLIFNLHGTSPVTELAVRRAIAALVDREAIATGPRDRTVDPLYSMIPAGIEGHTTAFFDEWQRPSLTTAKSLLQEAGIRTPVKFTYGYDSTGGHAPETKMLVRQLERGGLFEVTAKSLPAQKFWDATIMAKVPKFDVYGLGWLPDYPDPDTYVSSTLSTGNAYHNGYSNARIDALIRDTQKQSARSRTIDAFAAVDREVVRDVPVLPLWQRKDYTLSTDHISGIENLIDSTGAWRLWELSRD